MVRLRPYAALTALTVYLLASQLAYARRSGRDRSGIGQVSTNPPALLHRPPGADVGESLSGNSAVTSSPNARQPKKARAVIRAPPNPPSTPTAPAPKRSPPPQRRPEESVRASPLPATRMPKTTRAPKPTPKSKRSPSPLMPPRNPPKPPKASPPPKPSPPLKPNPPPMRPRKSPPPPSPIRSPKPPSPQRSPPRSPVPQGPSPGQRNVTVELPGDSSSSGDLTPAPTPSPALPSGGNCPDIQATLDHHNQLRALHGSPPLIWSSSLAQFATEYVIKMANVSGCSRTTAGMVHSLQARVGQYGENLAWRMGFSSLGYKPEWLGGCAGSVPRWYSEIVNYIWDLRQPYTRNWPHFAQIGHFTAVVWASTTRVGCGMHIALDSTGKGACQWVSCNYQQAGNMGSNSAFMTNIRPLLAPSAPEPSL